MSAIWFFSRFLIQRSSKQLNELFHHFSFRSSASQIVLFLIERACPCFSSSRLGIERDVKEVLEKNKKDFLCCREREKDFSTFDEADCVSAGDIFLQKVYSAVPLKIFQKNIKISFFHFENGNKLLYSLSIHMLLGRLLHTRTTHDISWGIIDYIKHNIYFILVRVCVLTACTHLIFGRLKFFEKTICALNAKGRRESSYKFCVRKVPRTAQNSHSNKFSTLAADRENVKQMILIRMEWDSGVIIL